MDHALVSKAKRTVNEAMNKDPQLALRFEYMVTSRQFNGKKVCDDPDAELLPSCCNKYHLLGTIRIVELLLYCEPSLSDKILAGMKKDDLEELQDFAFCLARPCAVPSKTWGVLKVETRNRYISIGGRRLMVVKFVKHGDKNVLLGRQLCEGRLLLDDEERLAHYRDSARERRCREAQEAACWRVQAR